MNNNKELIEDFDSFKKEIEDIFGEVGINTSVDLRKLYKKIIK